MASSALGSGLVEIAALTALIGSSTAESLTLGSRGAAGLPWAAVSSFGAVHVLRACVAAFMPSWLRDTLGVGNSRSDAAVGFSLDLKRKSRGGNRSADAVGVVFAGDHDQNADDLTASPAAVRTRRTPVVTDMRDVYVFDSYTGTPLRACAVADKDQPSQSFVYIRDPHWTARSVSRTKADLAGLLLSTVKGLESGFLWYYGADHLFWVTSLTWMYFFIAGVTLQSLGLAREYAGSAARIDILQGTLPTPQIPGGHRKVLLDAPRNVRVSTAWKLTWMLGSVISAGTLLATYMLLSRNQPVTVYIWTGFQILWMILRSVYFHFSEDTDNIKHAVTEVVERKTAPVEFRTRILGLVAAVSRYQMFNHPRGPWAYEDDLQMPAHIAGLIMSAAGGLQTNAASLFAVAATRTADVEIKAVIGDTLLSSATWFSGLSTTWDGMALYDCCLVAINFNSTIHIVSAARILSGPPKPPSHKDIENPAQPSFVPKGGTNDGEHMFWVYWIPLDTGWWLEVRTHKQYVTGKQKGRVLTSAELTHELERGDLLIDLTTAKEVEEIVRASIAAGQCLFNLITP